MKGALIDWLMAAHSLEILAFLVGWLVLNLLFLAMSYSSGTRDGYAQGFRHGREIGHMDSEMNARFRVLQ